MRGTLARAVVVAFACAAGAASLLADDAGEKRAQLTKAKVLLNGSSEASVRSGAEMCLKINDAEAMTLLLNVLEGEQPHFRDIVWETIPKFTDAYARQVVAAKLKSNAKNPHFKEWCAQALGEFGVADFLGALTPQLKDSDAHLRAAAARAIGRVKDKSAFDALKPLLADDDPFVRAAAIEAQARVAPKEGKGSFWGGLHDVDGGVRCALLGAVPEIWPELVEETAASALKDLDWRPRIQAVENLCAVKTKTSIDLLVPATGDARPVVARKANDRLQSVTGMKFTLPQQWAPWWKENREKFAFPEKPPDGGAPAVDDKGRTFADFNGLEVTSDHVAFVLDRSSDMLKTMTGGKTKDAASREEFEKTLGTLSSGVVFDVVVYGAKTQHFAKQPTPLDAKARADAAKFVAGVKCEGRKNIWEVLENACSQDDVDTVYLLSSGEPEVGLYVHWNRVCEQLAILNRHHKIVIHGVSYSDSKWYRDQIEHVATSTGGKFVSRE